MPFHVDFSAAASGASWRTVHCEKCNKPYHYALVRRAEATVTAAYGFGQGSAEDRADKTAQAKLMKRLEGDVEIVPCPICGWVQEDMVREARRRTARWLMYLAMVALAVGLCFAAFPVGESLFDPDADVTPAEKSRAAAGFLVAAGTAAAALIFRRMIQSMINPNAEYPKRPQPIPGMPVGIPGKAPVLPRGATSYLS